jgi:hypothetical protein
MNFIDLLKEIGIEGSKKSEVLVMRNSPVEPELRARMPGIAAETPNLYKAYNSSQFPRQEKALQRARFLASFIGIREQRAMFVGLFKVNGHKTITQAEYWEKPENQELRKLGMNGFSGDRPTCLWFDLVEEKAGEEWKGKLIINWPGAAQSWCRWADRNNFTIRALLEASALVPDKAPDAKQLVLKWEQLSAIPPSLRGALQGWRGIYFVFDVKKNMGYVGSAYGAENLFGRWLNYAATGHGGNKQLRKSHPEDLRFSILQLTAPEMPADEVIQLEGTWKRRLHTREYGLNDN